MPHVIVFAKAPLRGRVKSRLARDIGAGAALRFHRATLFQTVRRLCADPRWTTWLAVTPDWTAAAPFWPPGPARLPQGSGDLGARMARALAVPPRGPALIVGADIPDLSASHVARAFAALARADFVFGPAEDGGYWLVGARRARPLPARLFRGVRWSSPFALADSVAGLGPARIAFADILADVDDGAALARWRARNARRSTRRPHCP